MMICTFCCFPFFKPLHYYFLFGIAPFYFHDGGISTLQYQSSLLGLGEGGSKEVGWSRLELL